MAEDVDHAGNLAQTRDITVGNVGHMHLAVEGQHVVLAHREEVNVLHDDHLVVVFLEEGRVEHGVRVLGIATGENLHRLCQTHRRLQQSFTLGILAQELYDLFIMSGQLVEAVSEFCFWIHIYNKVQSSNCH